MPRQKTFTSRMGFVYSKTWDDPKADFMDGFSECRKKYLTEIVKKEVTTQQLSPVTHSYSIGLLVDIKIVEIEDTQKMSELSHVLWPYQMLVGGLEPWNFMTFHNIGNGIIIPTDEVIFFRGVGIPPTSMSLFKYWT